MPIQTISLRGRDQNLNNFCPFCGVKNSSDVGEISECPHLLFIYLNSFNFNPRLYSLLFMQIFQIRIIDIAWKLPLINFQVF